MENQSQQFVGAPCGQFGPYTFYSGFKYCKNGKPKELNLGDFFFVRISREEDPCIGELQFLSTNRNNDHQLSSLRLYFLPEQTPEGRLPHHGEDEVLVVADRIVLKLDDLVSWITEEVEWNHGNIAPCCPNTPQITAKKEIKEESPETDTSATTNGSGDDSQKNQIEIKEEKKNEITVKVELDQPKGTRVVIFSYASYCRYRCMLKRLEGSPDFDTLLRDPIVIALGGFSPTNKKTRVLFCRDSFEHDELAHHELNVEYLAPTLKGKRRKRRTKNTRSISPESITSEDCKDVVVKNVKTNGLKQPPVKNEQEFLQRLFKFMKKRNTPIHRVPHLGFKQIDLYLFYNFAKKLGGYDKITTKKLWKQVYDELGGNPSSTSAATCTRRHYEKLLLPFERHMEGIVYKPNNRGKKSQKKKQQEKEKETPEIAAVPPAKAEPVPSTSAEAEDAYAFTDSNHENSNSKDSNSNEFHSVADEQAVANEVPFSDEDSKTVWSIQKQPENKDEADKDETKSIKPLIIQKGQGESFAEKERKWDEIRRKSAEARKWVRQSRSNSQGSKNVLSKVSSEKSSSINSDTSEAISAVPETVKVKSETTEQAPVPNVPPFPASVSVDAKRNALPQAIDQGAPKLHPPLGNAENLHNVISKIENKKRLQLQALEQQSKISPEKKHPPSHTKAEPTEKYAKSWCGYSASSDHSSMHSGTDSIATGAGKTQPPAGYKAGPRSEPDVNRDYLMHHTGRQSVGSVSASSAVSVEASTNEEKPLVPQRRPSVIQHTEYAATSPSPSVSPMQNNSDICRNVSPKDISQSATFSSPKISLLPNQLSGYSMTGKVAEWLTKGVHEVVACKTPSAVVEKTVELHDQVMMPSSCKTPGAVGSSKISNSNAKNKHNTSATKSQRSKYSTSHRHRNSDNHPNGNSNTTKNDARNNAIYQKTFHPTPSTYNSVMTNAAPGSKYLPSINPSAKPEFYPHSPYYNQTKRFKCNNVLPTALPPMNIRPSLTPFIRQQVYRTSPLSDIPKTTATTHNDYEAVVLDLSLKKKPAHSAPTRTAAPVVAVGASAVPEEGVCLDLSIKKSNANNDNGIENITPPLPLSPNPPSQTSSSSYLHPSLKSLPTLISLQDFRPSSEAAGGHGYPSGTNRIPPIMTSSATVTASGAPLMHPSNAMFPMGTHSKLPPGMINTMPPVAYSKDIAKNLYMPSTTRHSQFSPYVIPPFFPTNWTSVVSAAPTNTKQMNNSQTSPVTYKGMINHSVFPKDYPSQYKSQFHPVLCKDNGHYPSSGK
ncbi:uncharacterized protein LOC129230112 [Uloborus diversus]|uniref:uncharacterized protein LOC129230112 n=1 Tax=Uloborus diversus TaxID=327109 RepID=UPI0024095802|nr:uncharacterized protein LOC129230112 [Uloborus diversus]